MANLLSTVPTLAELPYILEIPAESEVFAGYIFQITCVAQSDPPPRITWLKDGSMLTDASISVSYPSPMMSLLVIPQTQRTHAGQYTCVAENPAGQVTKSSKLKVKGSFFNPYLYSNNLSPLSVALGLIVCFLYCYTSHTIFLFDPCTIQYITVQYTSPVMLEFVFALSEM